MDCKAEQEMELEVLNSIYEGDDRFRQSDPTKFQYKFGDEGHYQSFIMEVIWTENYPESVPEVNLDVFYNSQITREVRDVIKDKVLAEAKNNLGMASTFSLIEFVKENFDDLVKDQPDPEVLKQQMAEMKLENADDKKDQLTKAQKRRIWDKVEAGKGGQVERGNDWVDIVKHLSQMGSETDL
ncbi:hypothetical protein L596_025595 [Steinernema carpocapsae]|uniref:RWD domain-containing protein n=1 Tax=Steinernema carpocapsae TaxID=34508 RepID=A0A4V5ZYV5_STECR|nr:hypothetical protein L596_025595 [Steinernema carpocapsae]